MGLFDWVKNLFGGKKNEAKIPQFMYDDGEDTITLTAADGDEVEFNSIAGIDLGGGRYYAILQPVELLDGMDDDEALVFRVTVARDGSDNFEIETNDRIVDAVFAKYNELLDAEG
ncbi:MAG: DUF1292 domain-containing protein [Clostridia bacterium]|nr:DUF1292 domain-containing protein [Clostridia bacterium]